MFFFFLRVSNCAISIHISTSSLHLLSALSSILMGFSKTFFISVTVFTLSIFLCSCSFHLFASITYVILYVVYHFIRDFNILFIVIWNFLRDISNISVMSESKYDDRVLPSDWGEGRYRLLCQRWFLNGCSPNALRPPLQCSQRVCLFSSPCCTRPLFLSYAC